MNCEKFLDLVYLSDAKGDTRHSAEKIVVHIDSLLGSAKFDECNNIFKTAVINKLSNSSIVSMLGITMAARRKLSCREKFYEEALAVMASRQGEDRAARSLARYK